MKEFGFSATKEKTETLVQILQDITVIIGERTNQNSPTNLETGGTVFPGLGFTKDAAILRKRAYDIKQGIFNIIVLGEFKHGKSTLLNALLKSKTLPSKAAPCTAIISILTYGTNNRVTIYETGKEPRWLSWEEFSSQFQLTKEDQETLDQHGFVDRFVAIEYAQIECENELCKNGVKLIDSPGLKENASRTKVTTKFLKQSQAVIFVLNATQILSEDEREFIDKFFIPGKIQNVFFVINRINLIEQDEVDEIKDIVKSGIKHLFVNEQGEFEQDLYNRRVFFVNAKGALDASITGLVDKAMLAASDVPRLELELEQFLTSPERTKAALYSTMQLLSWILSQAQQKVINDKSSLEQPLAELEKRRFETEKMLKELELNKQEIERTILLYSSMIKQKVYANLMLYLNQELKDTWPQDSERLIDLSEVGLATILQSFVWKDAKNKIAQAINKESQNYVRIKLAEWSDRIPTIIKADMDNMMAELTNQLGEFELKLDKIRHVFSGGKAEEIVDVDNKKVSKVIQLILGFGDISQMTGTIMGKGDWGSFFGRMLIQIISVSLIFSFFTGPISWLVLLVTEAIHVGMQHNAMKERILQALGEKLPETLQQELPKKQNEIYQSIEKQFLELANRLTQSLQQQINETRSEQNKIISQKKDQSFSVEMEKKRLQTISNKLLELFNQVSMITYGRHLTPQEIEQLAQSNEILI